MKRSRMIYLMIGLSIVVVFKGWGGEKTKKLQLFHRQLGNNLIKIKKQHPQSQTLVYSLLDQLGKYYSFSKTLLAKKKEYKRLLKAELTSNEALQKRLNSSNGKIEKMKTAIISASGRLQQDAAQVASLLKQKEEFAHAQQEFLKEKEFFTMEKEKLVSERDGLIRERDALVRERDALAREKDLLMQRGHGLQESSSSAPRSPR